MRRVSLLLLSFALTFVVFAAFVAYHVLYMPVTLPFEHVIHGTDLAQSHIRPGLNVDNLPLVTIDYGGFRPDENAHGVGDLALRRQACLGRGAYLGPDNLEVDCATYCNVAEDEVQYVYVPSQHTARVIVGRASTRAGAYCMPTLAATCNRNTSLVVYSLRGWLCLPTTDAFAGEGGNRIIVCDSRLWDRSLDTVHIGHIPPNLVFTDVYTDRLSDGSFRFACVQGACDKLGNKLINSPLNRLHTMRNWCSSDVPYSLEAVVDFVSGKCVCPEPQTVGPTGKCAACSPRFDPLSFTLSISQKPCFSFTDTEEDFARRVSELREQISAKPGDTNVTIFPCGYNSQGTSSEFTLPRCIEHTMAFNTPPMPSHNTLRTIDHVLS